MGVNKVHYALCEFVQVLNLLESSGILFQKWLQVLEIPGNEQTEMVKIFTSKEVVFFNVVLLVPYVVLPITLELRSRVTCGTV